MQKTRLHILDFLDQNQSATCLDLSRSFGQTPANVRHHLRLLLKEKRIRPVGMRKNPGRGRPELLYALGSQEENPALLALASALLVTTAQSSKKKLSQITHQIFGPFIRAGNLTQRLAEAVRQFAALDYQPSWEATPKGPHIHLQHCPFAEIIDEHPELCSIDAAALEAFLDQKVFQLRKLESSPEGLPLCTFALKAD